MTPEEQAREDMMQILDAWLSLMADLADAVGMPRPCLVRDPEGGTVCTEDNGHAGPHVATGINAKALQIWMSS